MGAVKNTYPSASFYNHLPFIHDMGSVAEACAEDLSYLRNLLDKHHMPTSVCVKLIHIHFHLNDGEILALRELNASSYGKIPFMEPTTPEVAAKLYGCNYIVDDSGDLQVFEYTTVEGGPDLDTHPAFVAEFCAAVVQRGVQHKFGLAINCGAAARGSWMELDFPEKRATFLLPAHVPLPQNDRLVFKSTITKFMSLGAKSEGSEGTGNTHIHVEHTWGSGKTLDGEEVVDGLSTKDGLHLTGIPLEPGTPFYTVASAISAAT